MTQGFWRSEPEPANGIRRLKLKRPLRACSAAGAAEWNSPAKTEKAPQGLDCSESRRMEFAG